MNYGSLIIMKGSIGHDVGLVKRAIGGDKKVLRQIVELNKKKIFYLAYDLTGSIEDAEDLSQEVFLKLFRSLKKYKGNALLSSWLYRITVNTFLSQKRLGSSKVRDNSVDEKEMETMNNDISNPNIISNPEKSVEGEQIQEHLNIALEKLSPRERAVFVLRNYQGMQLKSCSEHLNISEGTVKSLQFRAVKKLQKFLSYYKDQVFSGG